MQPVGRVDVQVLQAAHLPDLRWDPDEMAAVEAERLDRCQLRDGTRELDDPRPIFEVELSSRPEDRPPVLGGLVDELQHPRPRLALGVLWLGVELNLSGELPETSV